MVGHALANQRVKMALYSRAVGHVQVNEKVIKAGKGGGGITITEQLPPDVTAAMFWLTNRTPEEFKRSSELTVNRSPSTLRQLSDSELDALIAAELERAAVAHRASRGSTPHRGPR